MCTNMGCVRDMHVYLLQLEEIVSFLSHVPDPTGRPALHYVLSEWCSRHVRASVQGIGLID